jgi:hypothetical protein
MDKGPIFGQIGKNGPKSVQKRCGIDKRKAPFEIDGAFAMFKR